VGVVVEIINKKELVEWDSSGLPRVKQHFGRVLCGSGIGNMPVEDIRTSLKSIPGSLDKSFSHTVHHLAILWSGFG